MIDPATTIPPGYRVLRVLSERAGSRVFLAADADGRHCCLKVQRPVHSESLESLAATRVILGRITSDCAFIPMRRWGTLPSAGVLWEELELADDAVTGEPYAARAAESYTPLTLAGWVREAGPLGTPRVLELGIGLARAVAGLHAVGLFHRDIKPGNILVFRGRCVLGDYGSVGWPGSRIDFPGTEGYVPPDGLGSPALDVFALGRSLYEAWTGLDRFQFPSLPAGVLGAADWETLGWQLNRILTHAADKRPSHRLPTAVALADELEGARMPRRRLSRRRTLAGVAGMLAAGGAAYLWRSLPPFKAVWRRMTPGGFGREHFFAAEATCDWASRTLYSVVARVSGVHVEAVHADTLAHEGWTFPPLTRGLDRGILVPGTREIWAAEDVTGRVHRFGLEDKQLRTTSAVDFEDLGFNGPSYWNPRNRRLGRFAGYGNFACNNRRWEYDDGARRWTPVAEASSSIPLPRTTDGLHRFAGPGGKSWLVFGGAGNVTGRQGDRVPGMRAFDGHFHVLNDLWELDLGTDRWRQALVPQAWMPSALKAGICHPGVGGGDAGDIILFLCGSVPGLVQPARLHWRPRLGTAIPKPVPNVGADIELFRLWALVVDPVNRDLLVFADEGVFRVGLARA